MLLIVYLHCLIRNNSPSLSPITLVYVLTNLHQALHSNPLYRARFAHAGTYLGDYFGILMSHRVTGFPFNVLNDPMYVGSAMTHLGTALWKQSPVGIALSFWIFVVYTLALRFEGSALQLAARSKLMV